MLDWITAAAAGILWMFLRSAYEQRVFTVDEYEFKSKKIKTDRTLVFLSDLHDKCFGEGQKRLIAAIDRIRPDGVLIGGDMMVVRKGADIDAALFFVKQLARRYPVYCGNGNHESRMDWNRKRYGDAYDRYKSGLESAGVRCLSDSSAELGEDIRVSGLNISRYFYKKFFPVIMGAEYIESCLGSSDCERFQILLAHYPKFFHDYAQWGADLTLSGHYHGGIIRLPFLGGLITPQYEFFRKDCGGLKEENGRFMIVSRGLGNHSVNIRLNNIPQVVVVRLKAE